MNWIKTSPWGEYSDSEQNHKDKDYELDKRRKQKLGFRAREYKFDASGNLMYKTNVHKIMSKRFADNHQKL